MSSSLATSPHSPLHRAGEGGRDHRALEASFLDPNARLLVVDAQGRHEVRRTEGPFDPSVHVHLGSSVAGDASPDDPGPHEWFAMRGEPGGPTIREVHLSPLMHDIVTTALAVLSWHDRAPACERCGGQTRSARGGFVRECVDCGTLLFPRHDPAVIVAVVDPEDRLLLAHQASWPEGRISVLAGFVEAGESLEQTCGREILEEVALEVEAVAYVGSQSWPFPRSLMVGFRARAAGEPVPDGLEIQWARWFTREELRAQLGAGEVSIPGPGSLGRALIEAWLAEELG